MVHRARKKESKSNAIVFGVATDGFDYRFWRIDNKSKVNPLDAAHQAVTLLRSLFV